ncbi:MAG: class I adenylate-forming enzyme family protein [Rhodospirillaceae bacterium]
MRPFLTLHDPATARTYRDKGLWTDDTFYGLLAGHAAERPDALALRDGRRRLTWAEVIAWTDGVAADLRAKGLVAGDRVSMWVSNRIEGIVVFLACSREGLACNPSLHRTHTCADIVDLLRLLDTAAFVTEPGWGADRDKNDLDAMLADLDALRVTYTPDSLPGPSAVPDTAPTMNADAVGYLAFTSGTTGRPKCVMHSANTLMANARDLARDWGLDAASKVLSLSPLSHHIAWVGVAQWLIAGAEMITDDPPDGMARLDWVIDTEATYVMGVPTHAMDLLAQQRARGVDRLGAVKTFYMAGAPIPPTVAEAFVAQGIKPQNVYGMTENSSHQYTHPDDDTATIVATCGRGGPAYEIRIFDAENPDVEAPVGAVGQIGGKGAALTLGYFGNQEATQASFNRSGWFLSGDLGSIDAAGNLTVEGRLKDLIIRGGHNIYPAQIEALAVRHADVEKAAAFPIADERLGEKVCLAIIGGLDGGAMLTHLAAEGLSRYDMPEYFIRVDAFPLTASGKILKRDLIEMAKRGEIAPDPVRYEPKEG